MAVINEKDDKNEQNHTENDPLRENDQKEINLSFKEKIIYIVKNITVEPILLMFIMCTMISMTASQNLYLEKACRVNLNYSDEICNALKIQDAGKQNQYEKEAQKLLAKALTWKTYISATVPSIISLLAGSFSDITGYRIVFFYISIFGQILVSINNMIHTYFFYQIGLEYLVFSEVLIESINGGWCLAFLVGFAYISDITTHENRTYRMGFLSFSVTMAFPIGMGISGILLKKFGYYGCYGLATILYTINLLYITLLVKDPKKNNDQKTHDGKGICHLIRVFFSLSNVTETFSVLFKNAPKNRRVRLCILLGVVSVLFGPMYGEISIMYMSTRYRFNWDEVKFSLFQTYNFILHTIGTVFSILVFSKYLQWHDSLLGIVSTLSKIASSFIYCFAPNDKIFFLAPLAEILNGTALLAMRSIISKLVEPDELGKVNSLVGLVENLMPLLYVPLYTKVYTSTMETLPGAVFLLGAAMTLPAVFVLCYLFYEHRKEVKRQRKLSRVAED